VGKIAEKVVECRINKKRTPSDCLFGPLGWLLRRQNVLYWLSSECYSEKLRKKLGGNITIFLFRVLFRLMVHLLFSLSQRSGVAFTKLEKHLPSLVNLNEDPQLAEVLLYILQEGLSLTPVFILFLEAHEKQESFYV